MEERQGVITMRGAPLTLVGSSIEVGQTAPDFDVVDNDLTARALADYMGKALVIASVPSIDTSVCDVETRRFNQAASSLSGDVRILVISMDLPFAQKRWCGAAGVDRVTTLSDHRAASFGQAYGVLVKELRLLARAVFVVDSKGTVTYVEIVPELSEEPDYAAALDAVAKATA